MHRICFIFLFSVVFQYVKGVSVTDTLSISHNGNPKSYLLTFGISAGRFAVRDNQTSPLTYKGNIPGFQFGTIFYGEKSVVFFDFSFSNGKLATRNYPETDKNRATAYDNTLNIGYGRLIKTKKATKSDFYIGTNFGTIVNLRNNLKYDNANFNYEGFALLGPLLFWEKTNEIISIQQNLYGTKPPIRYPSIKWSITLFLPVIGGVARPPFPAINDFVDNNITDFNFNHLKIVSLNKLVCALFASAVSYNFRNRNGFKLSYNWQYFNYYPTKYKVSGVAGTFTFSFLLHLNKNR